MKPRRIGKLLVAPCTQPPDAPVLDGGHSHHQGRTYGSLVLSRKGGRAVAIGWQGARSPYPARWAWVPLGLVRYRTSRTPHSPSPLMGSRPPRPLP